MFSPANADTASCTSMVTAFYSPPQEVEKTGKRERDQEGGGCRKEASPLSFLSYLSDDFIDSVGCVRAKRRHGAQAVVAWM
ncbi:uncharacterized [Tachysurus ichikawai]